MSGLLLAILLTSGVVSFEFLWFVPDLVITIERLFQDLEIMRSEVLATTQAILLRLSALSDIGRFENRPIHRAEPCCDALLVTAPSRLARLRSDLRPILLPPLFRNGPITRPKVPIMVR